MSVNYAPQNIDTLIFPRFIVPIEPHNVFYIDYALAIDRGRILDLLPASEAAVKYKAKESLRLTEHVITSGLVNAHTHSPMTLFRGLADDLPLMMWLKKHIWPAETKWLSDEFTYAGTLLAIWEMLRSGTTCFGEHYLFPRGITRAIKEAQLRASVGLFAIDFPTAYAKNTAEYLVNGRDFYLAERGNRLLSFALAPHAPYSLSDTSFRAVMNLAAEFNLPLQIHAHESQIEIAESLKQYNMRPLARLEKLGLCDLNLQAVHMVELDQSDFEILKRHKNISVVHCPKSNLKLGNGVCKVTALLAEKILVAIGTDGAASNNNLDMFEEIRFAALLAKGLSHEPTAMPAADALSLATLSAAKALGLAEEIGSLKIGKAADLIAVDLGAAATKPVYNPISHLVYAVNSHQVSNVWVAGKRLLANGKLTTLDHDKVLALVKKWENILSK